MKDFGLVSIITPSYNCSKYVGKTIESIKAQTYQNWELLITDDCSSDNSIAIIEQYAKNDNRIKLFCMASNSGAAKARNNSIMQARGRYIAFCDSDDRWFPEKIEKQLKFMRSKNCALTYTSYLETNEKDKITGYVKCLPQIDYRGIIRDDGIGCLTAIYDKDMIGTILLPELKNREDWCIWINIIHKTGAAIGLQEPLALYLKRSGSLSSNKIAMLRYNYDVYHKVLRFNHFVSAVLLTGYFLPYYFYKKLKQKLDFACSNYKSASVRDLLNENAV